MLQYSRFTQLDIPRYSSERHYNISYIFLTTPNHNQIFQACIYEESNDYTRIGIKAISLTGSAT